MRHMMDLALIQSFLFFTASLTASLTAPYGEFPIGIFPKIFKVKNDFLILERTYYGNKCSTIFHKIDVLPASLLKDFGPSTAHCTQGPTGNATSSREPRRELKGRYNFS